MARPKDVKYRPSTSPRRPSGAMSEAKAVAEDQYAAKGTARKASTG
jgi:hypothetical protein